MKVFCEFCKMPLESEASGVYVHVEGWAKNRKSGGTNQVSLPRRSHRFACKPCIELGGGEWRQLGLFDD